MQEFFFYCNTCSFPHQYIEDKRTEDKIFKLLLELDQFHNKIIDTSNLTQCGSTVLPYNR